MSNELLGRFSIIDSKQRFGDYDYIISNSFKIGDIYELPFGDKDIYGILISILPFVVTNITYKKPIKYVTSVDINDFNRIKYISETNGSKIGAFYTEYLKWKIFLEKGGSNIQKTIYTDIKLKTTDWKLKPQQLLMLIELLRQKNSLLIANTGFGKTEVYLRHALRYLNSGKSVAIICPEILLSGIVYQKCIDRISNSKRIFWWHSSLSYTEKKRTILEIAQSKNFIIITTRSGLFLPLGKIDFYIFDEAHEYGFDQDSWPYYQLHLLLETPAAEESSFLFVTATPNTYLWNKIKTKELSLIGNLPNKNFNWEIYIGESYKISSELIIRILRLILNRKNVLIYINHRGYSNRILSLSTHEYVKCPICENYIYYHFQNQIWSCHYCNKNYQIGDKHLIKGDYIYIGTGIEKIYTQISLYIHPSKVIWISSDIKNLKYRETILDTLRLRKGFIIITTQVMIKGYHINNIHLSLMLDTSFNNKQFLSPIFSKLIQAAGRSIDQVAIQCDPGSMVIDYLDKNYMEILNIDSEKIKRKTFFLIWSKIDEKDLYEIYSLHKISFDIEIKILKKIITKKSQKFNLVIKIFSIKTLNEITKNLPKKYLFYDLKCNFMI